MTPDRDKKVGRKPCRWWSHCWHYEDRQMPQDCRINPTELREVKVCCWCGKTKPNVRYGE